MKVVIFLLIVGLLVLVNSQYSRSKSEYRTCHLLVGNRKGLCVGKHCYQMSTEIDGITIIKKGCLNATDTPSSLGTCSTRTSESNLEETWCLCNDKEKCNSAHGQSLLLGLLFSMMYLLL